MTGSFLEFSAKVRAVGGNPCVDVPLNVGDQLAGERSVRGTIDGVPMRANLTIRRGGGLRLFVNAVMRRAADVDVGDEINVRLRPDPGAREALVPGDLAEALREDPEARAVFERRSPSDRRMAIAWLDEVKHPATRVGRIEKLLARMHED